jgi:hypothetical protein
MGSRSPIAPGRGIDRRDAGRRMSADFRWPLWGLVNLSVFGVALWLPLVKLRRFYIFENEIVLAQVPMILARNGEVVLAIVVAVLGIAFPVVKSVLYCGAARWPRLVGWIGGFAAISFFDVFMVALLIFVAKGTVGADASAGVGIYPLVLFAVSSKLIDWCYHRRGNNRAA